MASICAAQQKQIDSLFIILKTAKEDTNKVHTLNNLSNKLWQIGDFNQAKKQADVAISLSQKLNFKKGTAKALNVIAIIYEDQNDYSSALTNYNAALKINLEIVDKKGIATSYGNIALIYRYLGNYPETLKNYFASLKIWEEINDKEGVARCYNNIGVIYKIQDNFDEALRYQLMSFKICKEINDKSGMASSYNNIGTIYKRQKKYDEALKNYFESLKIKIELSEKRGIANTYGNIGVIYEIQRLYTESLKNYLAALEIFEEIDYKKGIATTYENLGSIYIKLKRFDEANKNLQTALAISTKLGIKETIRDCYYDLANLDSIQGRWKNAYGNHKLYILYRDSLDNEETKEKTLQTSMSYEFEKKEALIMAEQDKRDSLTAIEMKKQQIIRYAISGILLLVLLFTLFLYNRFRLIGKQKTIIELKEKETQLQKYLIEEKQNEIIESITYAKRLQEAILPSQAFIDKNLKENFIFYKPKDIVAGDFYWAEAVNGLFFIAAADSTGHGVPGAMVSVVCSNALNRTIKEFKETEPGKILDKTRKLVIETFEKSTSEVKDGMDISLLCIDSTNKTISWSGAHNSLWYISESESSGLSVRAESRTDKKELIEIKADKQPIGKTEYPKPFTTHQIEYKEGTTFYLFTDGYADQFGGPNGKKFMAKNVKQVLLANSYLPLSKQKEVLEQTFVNWVGNLEQIDDVCIIGIRI